MYGDLMLAITTDNRGTVFIEAPDGKVVREVTVEADETERTTLGKVLRAVHESWKETFNE